jgi:transcriptional regulator with XRE-family HTH domain
VNDEDEVLWEGWRQVAVAINDRLADLGWDQAALVRASGVSATTVRWLQNASQPRYRPSTLTRVAKALGWSANAIERLRKEGEAPEPLLDPEWPQTQRPFDEEPPEEPSVAALSGKIERLSPRQRESIDRIVSDMLGDEPHG